MIETTIPEIKVEELMKRVRARVAEAPLKQQVIAGITQSPALPRNSIATPPQFIAPRAPDPKRQRVEQMLADARTKNEAPSWVPKPLRRFFLKQGGYNRILADAVGVLVQTNASICQQLENLGAALESHHIWLRRVAKMLDAMDHRNETEIGYLKAVVAHQIGNLPETTEPAPAAPRTNTPDTGESLDAFYAAFEDRFRLSPSRISQRQEKYVPYLDAAAAGTSHQPVLDIGCGRGEWLQTLTSAQYHASGIDVNSQMVARCRQRGLNVEKADAIIYLRSREDATFGAVTAFHIIEHLALHDLLEFFREVRRVLAPNGVAIFETPNCKNISVGACLFHIDPTHRHPVYPDTAEFMLQSCGFEKVEVVYLERAEGSPFHRETTESAFLDDHLFGPEDYALVGYKGR